MRTKRVLFHIASALLLSSGTLAATGVAAQDTEKPILLKLRYTAHSVKNLRMVALQKIVQTIQGQEVAVNQTLGMGYRFSVLKVDEMGVASVKVAYRSILWKQESPLGTMEYDSEHPPAQIPPAALGYVGLVGQGFTMRVTADGQVREISGLDALYDHVLEKLNLPNDAAKAAAGKSVKEQFGEQSIKEMMGQMMNIYPGEPVRVGGSWQKRVALMRGFPMILDTLYTLTAHSQGTAHIKVHTDIKSNPEAKPLALGPMKLSYVLTGQQGGELEIDEATGWTQHAAMTQKLSGTITTEGSPESPGQQTWPISIESKITITSD